MGLTLHSQPNQNNKFSVCYPLGAVQYIKEHALSGNILTEFHWGEYLIWDLYPQCRVSLDGRYEQVYPEDLSKEFFDFIHARGEYQQFLNKYPPDMILLSPQSKIYSDILIIKRGILHPHPPQTLNRACKKIAETSCFRRVRQDA